MPKEIFDKEKIIERIGDIKSAVLELQKFKKMNPEEFSKNPDSYSLAAFHLRIAIEAVLIIGTHILSRIKQNGKQKDYTQIILSLADYNVLPKDFAQKIKGMPGYRNRLVHLYWKIGHEELLEVIKNNLDDFDTFIKYIKTFVEL